MTAIGAADARGHVVGLDFWRAALMLIGVLLHGSVGLPQVSLFYAVDLISQTFRMGAFFGIAGVLTALVLTQRSPEQWLRRRFVQLGVPLTFGMTVISPFVWLIVTIWGSSEATPLIFQWHHLWFLAALMLYSMVTYALVRLQIDTVIVVWLERSVARGMVRPSTALLLTALACAILFGIAAKVMAATMSDAVFAGFVTLQLVVGYFPMFLLGYFMGRVPVLSAAMLSQRLGATRVICGSAAAYIIWFAAIAPYINPASAAAGTAHVRFVAAAICPPAAFILIWRSALDIQTVPALVNRISKASYTIYLLHFPIALAVNISLRPLSIDPHLSYAIAVVASAALSFAFHEHLVRHSAALKLILNGKPLYCQGPSVPATCAQEYPHVRSPMPSDLNGTG